MTHPDNNWIDSKYLETLSNCVVIRIHVNRYNIRIMLHKDTPNNNDSPLDRCERYTMRARIDSPIWPFKVSGEKQSVYMWKDKDVFNFDDGRYERTHMWIVLDALDKWARKFEWQCVSSGFDLKMSQIQIELIPLTMERQPLEPLTVHCFAYRCCCGWYCSCAPITNIAIFAANTIHWTSAVSLWQVK